MAYFARPNESSSADMEKASINNLQVLQKHVQKQIFFEQQLRKNLMKQIQSLQTTKHSLISLIQQTIQAQTANDPSQSEALQEGSLMLGNKSQLSVKLVASPKSIGQKSPKKSILPNRSELVQNKQKPKQKQVNYLANMNEYKHKDLVEEVKSLLKQLNFIIKSNSTSNKQLGNSSLLMQSNYKTPSALISEKFKDSSPQQQQFIQKYFMEFGELQKLPKSSPSESNDQVLTSLMNNLQKQQLKLIQNTWKYQKLQIKKMMKQNLQEKTIENMRLIYKEKKRVESLVNVKQVKSNKDIVKFGYTDKMISLIQDKTGFKAKLG